MSKETIQRGDVHDKHMKYVILRLDYSGVTDSKALTRLFDDRFPKAFNERLNVVTREVSLTLRKEDLKAISDAVSVPVSVIEKEQIVRYNGLKTVKGDVTLDISQFYICMTIKYDNNYEGLDKYLEYFKGAITVFKNKIDYFCPRRLGIRKCRVQDFYTVDELNTVFEKFVFDEDGFPIGKLGVLPREYRTYLGDETRNDVRVNIVRKAQLVKIKGEDKIWTSLDIDAHSDNPELLQKRDIGNIISDVNQFEFDVYKMCMRECELIRK